jgi:predicted GNAT family acetyltransferase
MAEHKDRVKDAAVVHNASKRSFEINIDDQLSILEYTFKNHRLFLTHTEVPPALESQGLGTELAHAVLVKSRDVRRTSLPRSLLTISLVVGLVKLGQQPCERCPGATSSAVHGSRGTQ